jgi:hypothetical protein
VVVWFHGGAYLRGNGDREVRSGRPAAPFDPECGAVLGAVAELVSPSLTLGEIPSLRNDMTQLAPSLTAEELARGGAFTVEDPPVSGPDGAPEILRLICRPTSATAPVAAGDHTHGGGDAAPRAGRGLPREPGVDR